MVFIISDSVDRDIRLTVIDWYLCFASFWELAMQLSVLIDLLSGIEIGLLLHG